MNIATHRITNLQSGYGWKCTRWNNFSLSLFLSCADKCRIQRFVTVHLSSHWKSCQWTFIKLKWKLRRFVTQNIYTLCIYTRTVISSPNFIHIVQCTQSLTPTPPRVTSFPLIIKYLQIPFNVCMYVCVRWMCHFSFLIFNISTNRRENSVMHVM